MDTFTITFMIIHWVVITEFFWLFGLDEDNADISAKILSMIIGLMGTAVVSMMNLLMSMLTNPELDTFTISPLTPLIEVGLILFVIGNLILKKYLKEKKII